MFSFQVSKASAGASPQQRVFTAGVQGQLLWRASPHPAASPLQPAPAVPSGADPTSTPFPSPLRPSHPPVCPSPKRSLVPEGHTGWDSTPLTRKEISSNLLIKQPPGLIPKGSCEKCQPDFDCKPVGLDAASVPPLPGRRSAPAEGAQGAGMSDGLCRSHLSLGKAPSRDVASQRERKTLLRQGTSLPKQILQAAPVPLGGTLVPALRPELPSRTTRGPAAAVQRE